MSAEDILRESEESALGDGQITNNVLGKNARFKKIGKRGGFSAMVFLTLAIATIAVIFSSGNLIPSAISERIIEETDIQYADAIKSKMAVFQQALISNSVPQDVIDRLEENGVLVGHFINEDTLSLKIGENIVNASDFVNEASTNIKLYSAFNNATYGRTAYYYDNAAQKVFREIGTTRNNYSADSSFDDVMNKVVGKGSNIDVNGVTAAQKTKVENGKSVTYYDYQTVSGNAKSNNTDAYSFVDAVREKNLAKEPVEALASLTETLNIADNISKEQKTSLFYLAFMENIGMMKVGEGSDSKINEAMSFLTKETDTEVVDVLTGELVTLHGSPLDSPSLYSILSGEPLKTEKIKNFSSDRILNTIENKNNISIDNSFLINTVVSTSKNIRGAIGKLITGNNAANSDSISSIVSTIDKSLINNSFDDINGIYAGEYLVDGAVNVGMKLAKASGATAGSAEAVKSYARVTSDILAMEAEIDRQNRSPFDINSKNTFLGSILYNFAINLRPISVLSTINTFTNTTSSAIVGLLPVAKAVDEKERYLATFGDNCKTVNSIGAVGTASCIENATFDMGTIDNIFSDPAFVDFVNNNTTLNNGVREVKKGSYLANFIAFSVGRTTPVGIMDGGILSSISSGIDNIPFVSNIAGMVKTLKDSDENAKRIATGAAFVNSSDNNDWQIYKYAQRYVSLARATESLKQFSSDETAYNNILFFEGNKNPVMAYLEEFIAQR